ncbi:MAG: triose-phosphate isomerase, partial [Nitrospinota bacterium]
MRTPLIAGNWKLHKTSAETKELIKGIIEKTGDVSGVDIVVAPSFTSLPAASEAVSGSSISLAAQNVFWEEKGAFTGEISAAMLTDAGCRYVIIGHSERRQFFGETNE